MLIMSSRRSAPCIMRVRADDAFAIRYNSDVGEIVLSANGNTLREFVGTDEKA